MQLPYGMSVESWPTDYYKPVSWWEIMRQFSALTLFWAGWQLEFLSNDCLLASMPGELGLVPIFNLNQSVADKVRTRAVEGLKPIANECRRLQLTISADTIDELAENVEKDVGEGSPLRNYQWLRDQFEAVRKLMEKEMKNKLFFHIPSERMRFLPKKETPYIFGMMVSAQFPSAKFDSEEAASCLTCGRATAGVFHLMRVLEVGLGVLGGIFDVSLEHTNWAPAIEEIESKIRKMHTDPKWKALPDCKELQSFYSQAASSFGVYKDAWRNHTMHVRAKYTEEEAGDIFDAVRKFMQKLSERLSEYDPNEEAAKFDAVVRKMMSVPHDEIVRREKEWKRKRRAAKRKRAKASPASRASSGKG